MESNQQDPWCDFFMAMILRDSIRFILGKITYPDFMGPEILMQEDKSFGDLIFSVWSLNMGLENLPDSVDSILGKEIFRHWFLANMIWIE